MNHLTALTDIQRAFMEEHMDLVPIIVSGFSKSLFDSKEDACQIGAIGLMKAARRFDADKGVRFSTFASACIRNELLMALRRERKRQGCVRVILDEPLPDAEGTPVCLKDMLVSPEPSAEDALIRRETLARVIALLRGMDETDTGPILRLALQGKRQAEIAALTGCTQSAVSRKLRRIRRTLREQLNAEQT